MKSTDLYDNLNQNFDLSFEVLMLIIPHDDVIVFMQLLYFSLQYSLIRNKALHKPLK